MAEPNGLMNRDLWFMFFLETNMKHDGGWKRSGSKYLFESKWFNLRQDNLELPSGDKIAYTVVEHPGYAYLIRKIMSFHVHSRNINSAAIEYGPQKERRLHLTIHAFIFLG